MTSLIKLSSEQHADLKISELSHNFARQAYLMPLTVWSGPSPRVALSFLLSTKNQRFNICGLFSVEPQDNLFVRDDIWLGSYQPLYANPPCIWWKIQTTIKATP